MVHDAHRDLDTVTAWIYLCYNYNATNVVPPQKDQVHPSLKRRAHFSNMYMSTRKKILVKSLNEA
jgi:hypothetical protein